MRKVSKNFYLISWIGAGILLLSLYVIGWIGGIEGGWEVWLGFNFLGIIPGIYLSIVCLVLLYKAWASIQDGQTPVGPGKAVGFFFHSLLQLLLDLPGDLGSRQGVQRLSRAPLPLHPPAPGGFVPGPLCLGPCRAGIIGFRSRNGNVSFPASAGDRRAFGDL